MTLHVLHPGLCTLIVDEGRPRSRSLGVPVGGAADRFALALGNLLVGNPPGAPALEVNLAGPRLRAGCELGCILSGAPFVIHSDRQPLAANVSFTLEAGEEFQVGSTDFGARAYLCVRGGVGAPLVLASASTFEPLSADEVLPCKPGRVPRRFVRAARSWGTQPIMVRVLAGPQADWFAEAEFYGQEFTVTLASNRMGVRLRGCPLTMPERELVSEPVAPGAVQVTRDGQCILLGMDGQTIGGYPKIAHVITADLDLLGQLRPGDRVRFEQVSLEQAEERFDQRQQVLQEWAVRLRAIE